MFHFWTLASSLIQTVRNLLVTINTVYSDWLVKSSSSHPCQECNLKKISNNSLKQQSVFTQWGSHISAKSVTHCVYIAINWIKNHMDKHNEEDPFTFHIAATEITIWKWYALVTSVKPYYWKICVEMNIYSFLYCIYNPIFSWDRAFAWITINEYKSVYI